MFFVNSRSSVTRMSVDQKQNVIQRTSEEERAALASLHPEDKLPTIHSLARAQEEREAEDAETGGHLMWITFVSFQT